MTKPTILALLFTSACAASIPFDPAPGPAWIGDAAPDGVLGAIGISPATADLQGDLVLATRDAEKRLAERLESQVRTWASDVEGSAAGSSAAVLGVDVRSEVKLEETAIARRYRDERTGQQYVWLELDRARLATRVAERLSLAGAEVARALAAADAAAAARRTLPALRGLALARPSRSATKDLALGRLLLGPRGEAVQTLEGAERRRAERARELAARACFEVVADGGPAAGALAEAIARALGAAGIGGGPCAPEAGVLRIRAAAASAPAGTALVGDRTEHVATAVGRLELLDGDGRPVPELGFDLTGDALTDRGPTAGHASEGAARLAADTLAGRFRSALRRYLEVGP